MIRIACLLLCLTIAPTAVAQAPPKPLVAGLKNLRFVTVAADGTVYLSVAEHEDTGKILILKDGKLVPFVRDLDDPRGLVAWKDWLFVAEERGILRIDRKGKVEVFAANARFPVLPKHLMSLTVDAQGTLYAADAGTFEGDEAALYRIPQQGKITAVTDDKRFPGLRCPWGVTLDGAGGLLVSDRLAGAVSRVRLTDGNVTKVADGLGELGCLARDQHGRLYVSAPASFTAKEGRVLLIAGPGQKATVLAKGMQAPTGLWLDAAGKRLLVADPLAGTLTALPLPALEKKSTRP